MATSFLGTGLFAIEFESFTTIVNVKRKHIGSYSHQLEDIPIPCICYSKRTWGVISNVLDVRHCPFLMLTISARLLIDVRLIFNARDCLIIIYALGQKRLLRGEEN